LEEIQRERPKKLASLYDLGFQTDYKLVWDFQKELVERRIAGTIPDSLILVEHDHVLTMGRNSHRENILIQGLPSYEIERGGDVTYHGPGQLVAYPIVSLADGGLGVRQFIEKLEAVIVETLGTFGLASVGKLGPLTGVWVDGYRKIASIGVACSHWVTYHGLALNVSTNLSYFQKIKPCGFEAGIMTSLERELGNAVDMRRVKESLLASFSVAFGAEFSPIVRSLR
jgi:lipoyl(octanoyl) transferase